jgi:hypothetical protein
MSTGPFITKGEVKSAGLAAAGDFHVNFQNEIKDLPRTMGIALVDLTSGVPRYAVSQEHVEKHVFSLAKIAPLFAAFRLRERLRNQFGGDPAKDSQELIAKIEKAWKAEVAAKVAGRMAAPDFPNLKRIFDFSGPPAPGKWDFRFLGEDTGSADRAELVWKFLKGLDRRYKGSIPDSEMAVLVFMHRLKLMVRMSDDMAAGSVASDIGLAYMFGVLTTEGLYSPGKHGLWLSNTYGFDKKFMGFEGPGDDITAGATAFSVAEYFTRLFHMKTLVDKESCEQMLDILKERSGQGIGTFSRFLDTGGLPDGQVTHSKIGLWRPTGNTSEGAVIQSRITVGGAPKDIKYIAVGLQDVGGNNMVKLIKKMDAYVKKVNGAD